MGTMTTSFAVWLTSFTFNPAMAHPVDDVDLAEINHVLEDGRLTVEQIIFYDWCPTLGRFQVRDWRMLNDESQIPLRNWRDRNFVSVWRDFKERGALRMVRAKIVLETWTSFDPELAERQFLPHAQRRVLQRARGRD